VNVFKIWEIIHVSFALQVFSSLGQKYEYKASCWYVDKVIKGRVTLSREMSSQAA